MAHRTEVTKTINGKETFLENPYELNYSDIYVFGELLIEKISQEYDYLISDNDWSLSIENNINLFKKVLHNVVRLNQEKCEKIDSNEFIKEMRNTEKRKPNRREKALIKGILK